MVSTSVLAMMALDAILGFVVPVALAWWMVKKYHVSIRTILIGAGVFVVFALVLEPILLHFIVDACAVVLSKSAVSTLSIEAIIFCMSLAVGAISWMLARKLLTAEVLP